MAAGDPVPRARAAFTDIVECNGSESFYAFSLYSISDHTGIYAAANSIEGFRRRLRQYRESGLYSDRAIASFAKDVRWSVGDWKYFGVEAPGQKEFDSIYRVLTGQRTPTTMGDGLSRTMKLK